MAYQVLSNVLPSGEVLDMLGQDCQVHVWTPDHARLAPILPSIEGIWLYGHLRVDGPFMDMLPTLRVISNTGVGVDHIDLQAARERGIPVCVFDLDWMDSRVRPVESVRETIEQFFSVVMEH